MSKRRTRSPEFKTRVAMEAVSGLKTIQEIAADHPIQPIQVSKWKCQLLDGASELFTRGKKTMVKEEGQAKEAELFQQIGRLQMELKRLNKSLSCSDARELRKKGEPLCVVCIPRPDCPYQSVSRVEGRAVIPEKVNRLVHSPCTVRNDLLSDSLLGDVVEAQGLAPAPGRQRSGSPCDGRASALAGA